MSGIKFPVRPENYQRLLARSSPQSASQPESVPWVYYDQRDLASLWTQQSFFAQTQNDPTLGNIEQGGQMPAGTYFEIQCITFDFMIPAVTTAVAPPAVVNDVLQILYGARAILNITIANKNYGPVPLTFLHSSGGPQIAWVQAAAAEVGITNWAQNAPVDGGYWTDGALILPPGQNFTFQLQGVAAALAATRAVRLSLVGTKYRPVT